MNRNKLESLAYEIRNNWITLDGSGKLELTDERTWNEQEKFSSSNENGILFLTMYMFAFHKLNLLRSLDGFRWIKMVELTRHPIRKGIFFRRQNDTTRTQSHDNVIALIAGSLLFQTSHRFEIREEVYRNFFRYQVVEGEKWYQSIIQGGDVAVIDICCGKCPNVLFLIWMIGGLLVPKKDAGQLNLARLRIDALQIAIKTYPNKLYNKIYRLLPWLFNKRYKDNHKSIEAYFGRDTERNPYIDLMEAVWNLKQ